MYLEYGLEGWEGGSELVRGKSDQGDPPDSVGALTERLPHTRMKYALYAIRSECGNHFRTTEHVVHTQLRLHKFSRITSYR